MFSEGNFNVPMFIHAQVPPGVDVMQRLKDRINYEFAKTRRGALLRISTTDAEALDAVERARVLISELQQRMEAISRRTSAIDHHPTVACVEWIEPLMAAGNWMPELVEMAGGINLFGAAGKHAGAPGVVRMAGVTWRLSVVMTAACRDPASLS